jgi:hypothetical protein
MQLRQGDLPLERALRWFGFIDQAHHGAVRGLIRRIKRSEVVHSDLAQHMFIARDVTQPTEKRAYAIDQIFDQISTLLDEVRDEEGDGGHGFKRGWWVRTCLAWRSSLYSWPVMWGGGIELAAYGMGLPLALQLKFDGRSTVSFSGDPQHLRWTSEWVDAFHIGMRAAKELWRSQNGRIRVADEDAFEQCLTSSLVVDVRMADAVVSVLYSSDNGSCELNGPSAQAYWAIAILGLLNGTGANLQGAATGRLERANGSWYLRPVGNIRQKLRFANAHGHSRLVIPGQEEESVAAEGEKKLPDNSPAESMLLDDEPEDATRDYLAFREDLKDEGTELRLEVNLCPDLRTAADALSQSGWRRSSFVRLPEMQGAFTYTLRRLFLHENPAACAEQTNSRFSAKHAWREEEERELEGLRAFLLGAEYDDTVNPVRFVAREDLAQEVSRLNRLVREDGVRPLPSPIEATLGKWLAWEDHRRRQLGADGTPSLPGIGLLAIKTMPGERDDRVWGVVASELGASNDWYSRFRWAVPEQAAIELAHLLDNVPLDRDISSSPPPDLLVVFDEAGITQNPMNAEVITDRIGSWMEIVNPKWHGPGRLEVLSEALSTSKAGLGIHRCRVLVIHGVRVDKSEKVEGLTERQIDLLQKLAVFRFTFSEQAGFHLYRLSESLSVGNNLWLDYQQLLNSLQRAGVLRQTRGRFFIKPTLLPSLRGTGEFEDRTKAWWQPEMQERAAEALCPVVQPSYDYRSQNRDAGSSSEAHLEATYHISRAIARTHQQQADARRRRRKTAQSLALLQQFPGWDTVSRIRDSVLSVEAYDIARELLTKQEQLVSQGHLDIQNTRAGSLLAVISQLKTHTDLSVDDLLEQCHQLYEDYFDANHVGLRLANRIAASYVMAVDELGGSPHPSAIEILENAVADVEQDDFLECEDSRALNCSMSFPWWRRYSNVPDSKERRRRLRLEIRASVRRYQSLSTSPLCYDAWINFFSLKSLEVSDEDVHEVLRLWNRSVRIDGMHLTRFSTNMRARSTRRLDASLNRSPHAEALHEGGLFLMKMITCPPRNLDLDVLEAAAAYVSTLNFSDRSLGFDLLIEGPSLDLRLLDWLKRTHQVRGLVRHIIANSGAWVAMITRDEAPNVRFARTIEALKARKQILHQDPMVIDASGDHPLSVVERELWTTALDQIGALAIHGDLAAQLEEVSKQLSKDLEHLK